jgi:hypothetical protein
MLRTDTGFEQRFPQLFVLLAAYLDQDLTATPREAVESFVTHDPDTRVPTARQMRKFLGSFDDTQLEQILDMLMFGYDYAADGLDARGWLTQIALQLER